MKRGLTLSFAIAWAACEPCTTSSCEDMAILILSDASATGTGDYVFELEVDGSRTTSLCTVPSTTVCTFGRGSIVLGNADQGRGHHRQRQRATELLAALRQRRALRSQLPAGDGHDHASVKVT